MSALVLTARKGRPLLPAALLGQRRFTAGSFIGLALNFGFYGQLFVVSLYLQRQLGYSPTAAGFALLPETAIGVAASALGGRAAARYGPRPVVTIGLVLGAAGFAGLAFADQHTPYLVLVVPLLLTGFGTAFTMPAATAATVSAAPATQAGLAGAAFNAARQLGGSLGVAVSGSLLTLADGSGAAALACMCGAFLLASLLAYTRLR